jgi:hypothetical protein
MSYEEEDTYQKCSKDTLIDSQTSTTTLHTSTQKRGKKQKN